MMRTPEGELFGKIVRETTKTCGIAAHEWIFVVHGCDRPDCLCKGRDWVIGDLSVEAHKQNALDTLLQVLERARGVS